jgi:putative addiction module killer protein
MEVLRYLTESGKDVFGDWFAGLRDLRTRARIAARIARLSAGNFGDCKSVRGGVWELRIPWGPRYRVDYARAERTCVLLLCGGDKRSQSADVERAIDYWNDYKRRTGKG